MEMEKIDLKKELKAFYNPTVKDVTLVDVPEMNFMMIDGKGAPESPQFSLSIQALYPVAYTIKFVKKADGRDYGVMPLEGLFWANDMAVYLPETADRNQWQWTLMIMQPAFVTKADFNQAKEGAKRKKDNPFIDKVRFESFGEGKSAQIMHIGRYSAEGNNIQRIHHKISEIGGKLSGKHHEIYLSDPRRVTPDKMKTVLRQPYSL
jgi:Uncharacterized conserved protein